MSEREPSVAPLRLRLYVAADSPNSAAAVKNLRALLAEQPDVPVELEIIDILRFPERGLSDAITVTPMLVKFEPLPIRRVLGNLRDRVMLLGALGLDVRSAD